MKQGAGFGLVLAVLGTLVLTPVAMFMRLSEMDGFQMAAWRGALLGGVLLLGWAIVSRDKRGDWAQLRTGPGLAIVISQFFNSTLFCLGIAAAPAAVVLLGVAAVPVFAAVLSWLVLREATSAATWITIAVVVFGIGLAVTGKSEGVLWFDGRAIIGAALGLGVAFALAVNFVVLRAYRNVPILLTIGVGGVLAGVNGLALTGVDRLAVGHPWAMIMTGAVVLPLSFFLLSVAARYTHAAHVSLLMLMETVLGPLWVWLAVGEAPTWPMVIGGVIVVGSLAIYLIVTLRRAPRHPP